MVGIMVHCRHCEGNITADPEKKLCPDCQGTGHVGLNMTAGLLRDYLILYMSRNEDGTWYTEEQIAAGIKRILAAPAEDLGITKGLADGE